jgi:hypothetical protein
MITGAFAVCGGGYLGVEALPEELRTLELGDTRV